MEFRHNPVLAEAITIPSHWYCGPKSLDADYDDIFSKTWNLVGRSGQLSKVGDYITAQIGREQIVITVPAVNQLAGFFNVCRHRAGPVAVGNGNASSLRCRYHSWTYDLSGKLCSLPEFEGVKNFCKETTVLPSVEVRKWGPLIFAAINPAMTFAEFMGTTSDDLAYLKLDRVRFFCTKDYEVKANWKVYVENFLEPYHLPSVHPTLCRELDYQNYRVDTFRWYSTQDAAPKKNAQLYAGSEKPGAHYYWFFPNLMFNIYQGMLQTNLVIPTGPEECIVRFDWYLRNDRFDEVAEKMPDLMRFSDEIQLEDKFICESVQRGLFSASYQHGRYSVKRENGVHHFHGLVSEMHAGK